MAESNFYIEVIKNAGVPALFFIALIFVLKSWMKILEQLISSHSEDSKRTYERLKEMAESNHCNIAQLARIEQKIDTNTWCPLVKEKQGQERRSER